MFDSRFFYSDENELKVICLADESGIMWRSDFIHVDRKSAPRDELYGPEAFVGDAGKMILSPSLKKVMEQEVKLATESAGGPNQ